MPCTLSSLQSLFDTLPHQPWDAKQWKASGFLFQSDCCYICDEGHSVLDDTAEVHCYDCGAWLSEDVCIEIIDHPEHGEQTVCSDTCYCPGELFKKGWRDVDGEYNDSPLYRLRLEAGLPDP